MAMNDLSNIKVGDKVIVYGGYGGETIKEVEKITPKGFIRVNGILYNQTGTQRSSDRWFFSRIEPVTEEKIEKLRRRDYVRKITNKIVNMQKSFTYDQAVKIAEIMGWD